MKTSRNLHLVIIGSVIALAASILLYMTFIANKESDISSTGILVQHADFYAETIKARCKTDTQCAAKGLELIAENADKGTMLATFLALVTLFNDDLKSSCHETAHHLGMWLYTYLGNVDEALSYSDQLCGGAVIHGVTQQYFASLRSGSDNNHHDHGSGVRESDAMNQNLADIGVDITGICSDNPANQYDILRWQCIHGIGHGLSVYYDHDVFAALENCEVFEPGWEQISCSKGASMENVVYYYDTGKGTFDEDDILFPCNAVQDKYAPACYQYHTSYILKQKGFEYSESFDECDKIEPEEFVKYCYHGMGRQLSGQIGRGVDTLVSMCTSGKSDQYHSDCLRGLVMTHVNRDRDMDRGIRFCKAIPEQFKPDCYDAMGKWAIMLHGQEVREAECFKAESSEYFDICMNASLDNMKLL